MCQTLQVQSWAKNGVIHLGTKPQASVVIQDHIFKWGWFLDLPGGKENNHSLYSPMRGAWIKGTQASVGSNEAAACLSGPTCPISAAKIGVSWRWWPMPSARTANKCEYKIGIRVSLGGPNIMEKKSVITVYWCLLLKSWNPTSWHAGTAENVPQPVPKRSFLPGGSHCFLHPAWKDLRGPPSEVSASLNCSTSALGDRLWSHPGGFSDPTCSGGGIETHLFYDYFGFPNC